MEFLKFLLPAFLGYLIGSIPVAVLIAKKHGVDIFKEGSGNPGATNVKRVLGPKAGNLTFALDFLKGSLAAYLPIILFKEDDPLLFYFSLIALVSALIGHSFSIFIKFRGGKGVATSMGGLAILTPLPLLFGLSLWLLTFYLSRFVSLASITFALSLPISSYLIGHTHPQIILTLIISSLILIRHRSNIKRLILRQEHKFSKN